MKEQRELIDVVVEKLKNTADRPYKAGAWEQFQSGQKSVSKIGHRSKIWYAAAILLCFGLAAGLWRWSDGTQHERVGVAQTSPSVSKGNTPESPKTSAVGISTNSQQSDGGVAQTLATAKTAAHDDLLHGASAKKRSLEPLWEEMNVQGNEEVSIPKLSYLPGKEVIYRELANIEIKESAAGLAEQVMASTTVQTQGGLALKSPESQSQRGNIRLGDRLELGLFVSPYATSNQMKVGGGLAVSYKLNRILSVRTGASYNNYEIQMIKNPIDESSTEVVAAETNAKMSVAQAGENIAQYQQQMIIPNVNAITGFVRSVDIPLEIKVNDIGNSFYATAGMSYSAILGQQRNAHYVENLNIETFAEGYPETKEQVDRVVKPVMAVVESSEENVSSNGFSGFVNFSVGKNIRVNKKIGFSVEPYLKIPVGQYRRAEMDYTNGGIRIMTNF